VLAEDALYAGAAANWMPLGACQSEDPELFFPAGAAGPWSQIAAAKQVRRGGPTSISPARAGPRVRSWSAVNRPAVSPRLLVQKGTPMAPGDAGFLPLGGQRGIRALVSSGAAPRWVTGPGPPVATALAGCG
jgi:hypothetical protein